MVTFARTKPVKAQPAHDVLYKNHVVRVPESKAEPSKSFQRYDSTIPIVYAEFELDIFKTTLRLDLSPTDIEIGLTGLPNRLKSGE